MARGLGARLAALAVLLACALPNSASAHDERDLPSEDKPSGVAVAGQPQPAQEIYSLHFQLTGATQYHPRFFAKYSGQNSLSPDPESATAFVTTLYGDLRLWPGAELLVDPEMSGGTGLSSTLGVAAFPSGIAYRVGDPAPSLTLARLAISQTIGLGGGKVVNRPGPNELGGTRDRNVLAITLGRFSVLDVVDANRYSNDPTTQFMSWALFASGAYDYPADTHGYTYGAIADLAVDWWSVRAGIALEPYYANLETMDWRIDKSRGLMAEYEARYWMARLPGALSVLTFLNTARMGDYRQLLADPAAYGNSVAATRQDGRMKFGFAISLEQRLTRTTGAFARLSYNDGRTESWSFTEIDQSFGIGVTQNGALWKRPGDAFGAAAVVSGLSPWHERYLAGGGYGFIIGDGPNPYGPSLRYAPELVGDIYYKFQITDLFAVSAIYQPIVNPAYNEDRGPVHVISGRFHTSF